jgi:hypothetical protein
VSPPSHRCCRPRPGGNGHRGAAQRLLGDCWVAASGPAVNIEMVVPSNALREQAMVAVTGAKPLDVISPIVAQQMSATAGQPVSINPDDAVIYFFGQNQMHPAFGATEVSVPQRDREHGSGSPACSDRSSNAGMGSHAGTQPREHPE